MNMKKNISKSVKGIILCMSVSCIYMSASAQDATVKPAAPNAQMNTNGAPAPKPMTDAERQAQADKMKADRELNMKMGQLNKEIQEAEKAGKADAPETVAKKAELKKLQDERREKTYVERIEKRTKKKHPVGSRTKNLRGTDGAKDNDAPRRKPNDAPRGNGWTRG